MATFVLVHGAWHGAWCWARVLPLLRAAGHTAHAVTLTGVGERAHLLARGITLDTHIADAANLVRCEELDDVILVGHSYGGLVITGTADRLLAERLEIHLDYFRTLKRGETQHLREIERSLRANEVQVRAAIGRLIEEVRSSEERVLYH